MKSGNISEERLEQLASGNAWTCVQDDEGTVMARELRTYRNEREAAVPVAWISERNLKNLGKSYSVYVKHEPVMVRPIPLYPTPPAQPVAVSEWTNEQCLEFLSIAFRHAEIKGDIEMDDIRLGIKMVNSGRAAMLKEAK